MASSSQNLTTNIVINASVGNGFSKVGSTLTELGSMVNGISQNLINFGKDSVNVYREYEKSMKNAEVALSTAYGRNTRELSSVMSLLDASATEWAATTIFHTNDVANAISEAAHAGWDYDQIMAGIPAAMELAQAGSLDLSEAVNYIVKSTNAAGIEFDSLTDFIDIWTFAANSSATTIGEVGDAMLRMGSTMRFAADPEELLTLIAVTANAGSVGTEAGTMVRNSLLRLISPTQKAADTMAELGATSDEVMEILGDEKLSQANELLSQVGFSAYDSEGQMMSVLDIYRDLYLACVDLSGGITDIDDLVKNQDVISVLGAIFPTRTITEALTLIRAASEDYDGLYDAMKNGEAEGYGAYAAETMMNSLDGRIETFNSKVERLKQVVGEELSDDVSSVLGVAGGFIDNIAEMDEAKLGALVSGLEMVAAVGPGLLIAGTAFRLLGNPMGLAGLGITAVLGLAAAAESLRQSNLEAVFGDGNLDGAALSSYISSVGDSFREAYSGIDEFNQALSRSVFEYKNATGTLSSQLLTASLTGKTLSEEEANALIALGDEAANKVLEGLTNSTASQMTYWTALFGGEGVAEDNEVYQQIILAANESLESGSGAINAIGQNLRDAMFDAFRDGKLTSEERQLIEGFIQELDAEVARLEQQARDAETYASQQTMLNKARGASWQEVNQLAGEAKAQTQEDLQWLDGQYQHNKYLNEYNLLQSGMSPEEIAEINAATDAEHATEMAARRAASQEFISEMYRAMFSGSDISGDFAELEAVAAQVTSGMLPYSEALGQSTSTEAMRRGLEAWVQMLGGLGSVAELAEYYASIGDIGNANDMLNLSTMYGLAGVDTFNAAAYGMNSGSAALWSYLNSQNSVVGAQIDDIVPVEFQGDFEPIEEGLSVVEAEEFVKKVDGDTQQLRFEIHSVEDGSLVKPVKGNMSMILSQLQSIENYPVYVNVVARKGAAAYAEGGRATTASIFGEAGPEWAIPEEHTQRTAELLAQAASASGFTWTELLNMSGGLNSRVGGAPTTIVYSPVINGGDTSGIEQILKDDKARLMQLLAEQKMIGEMETYA